MKLVTFIAFLFCACSVDAANKYLRAGASGAATGNNWTDAYTTLAALETGLTRGDTGYVAAGNYGTDDVVFNTAVSGATLITIKKATVADHGTDTGWNAGYASGQAVFPRLEFASGYWVIDGAGRTGWTTGYGILITQGTGAEVINVEAPNVTVLYCEVAGGGDDGNGAWPNNDGVSFRTTGGGDNFRIAYCYLRDFGRCVFFCNQAVTGVIVEHCYTGRYESTGTEHSELASLWGGAANWTFRYNLISYTEGTGGIIYDNVGHNTDPIHIYGNVFDETLDGPWEASNGVIGGWDSAGAELYNARVFNNTFIGLTVPIFANRDRAGSNGATNNLFYNCSALGFDDFNHNYNHFINSGGTYSESQGTSSSGDPFMDYPNKDYRLAANTTAGFNLGSPFNTDRLGNPRTTWTRGALEYQSGEPLPPAGEDTSAKVGNLNVGTLIIGTP